MLNGKSLKAVYYCISGLQEEASQIDRDIMKEGKESVDQYTFR